MFELTKEEQFVIQEMRKYDDEEYADFSIEKRRGKYTRVVASVSAINPQQ